MTLTLLIDLDDTLLTNPLESFMPAYIKLLSEHLSPFVSPEKMIPQLLYATDKMIQNTLPNKTLEAIFAENFYPQLGLRKADLESSIKNFYLQDFHKLQKITTLRPEALEIISYARSRNFKIVVATNPLFPQIAMQSRLSWAGFPPDNFPFDFVTSYENMHFSKPNSAYYTEILGILGWPQQPVCMVGNSLKEDILPASALGIPGFYVDGDGSKLPNTVAKGSISGSLDKVIPWLDELEKNPRGLELKNAPALISMLSSTPAALETLAKGLDEQDWKSRSAPSSWSVLESISHLFDVENEITLPRLEQILANKDPFLVGVDSDTWVTQRNYNQTMTPKVLDDFLELRIKTINILTSLNPSDWQRTARHSIFGPTTLLELVGFIATHEQDHIRQVYNSLSAIE